MEPFQKLRRGGRARSAGINVDTDQILPGALPVEAARRRLRQYLFHDLRFDDNGAERPDFVLNRPALSRKPRILVGEPTISAAARRARMRSGRSTTTASAAVIAPSFGDIFFNSSFQNGLLPVVLTAERVAALRAALEHAPGARLAVDLAAQEVRGADGVVDRFEVDPFRKECLLAGLDNIAFTLRYRDEIAAFEKSYEATVPWL